MTGDPAGRKRGPRDSLDNKGAYTMRILLLGGASFVALAATPALAAKPGALASVKTMSAIPIAITLTARPRIRR